MTTHVMSEAQAVEYFLRFFQPQSGVQVFSGFVHGLRETRGITNRDSTTGQKLHNATGKHGSWLGAIGYFTLLDQVGKCFKPRSVPRATGNSIFLALKHFSSLPDAEIDALYALRCAFAHDYSLYNINIDKPNLTHNFVVGQGNSTQVVFLPKIQWNGDLQHHHPDSKTTVNLEAFGDLVESVVQGIAACHQAADLEILLPGGSDELVRRYMFMAPA